MTRHLQKSGNQNRNQREVGAGGETVTPSGSVTADGRGACWRQTRCCLHSSCLGVLVSGAACSWPGIHSCVWPTHTDTQADASRSIPCCPPQIFHRVSQTDSLIWFTLPPFLPSCLESHLLYFLFQSRETGGGGAALRQKTLKLTF